MTDPSSGSELDLTDTVSVSVSVTVTPEKLETEKVGLRLMHCLLLMFGVHTLIVQHQDIDLSEAIGNLSHALKGQYYCKVARNTGSDELLEETPASFTADLTSLTDHQGGKC